MKINLDDWAAHLNKGIQPFYLISGDEILLQQQAQQQLQQHLKAISYHERIKLPNDQEFKWSQLQHQVANSSLFSSQRFIEVHWNKATFPKEAQTLLEKLISQTLQSSKPDLVIAIFTPKLDASVMRSRWYTQLLTLGTHLTLWPIERNRLPRWIQQQAQQARLSLSSEVAEQLSIWVEGNLLAAAQSIEKLSLRYGQIDHVVSIDSAQLQDTISKSADYSLFDFIDCLLQSNTVKSLEILQTLQASGEETILILWAISKELRILSAIKAAKQNNTPIQQVFDQHKIWKQRQKPLLDHAQRLSSKQIIEAQHLCHHLDLAAKGQFALPVDLLLRQLVISLTTAHPLPGLNLSNAI